MPTTWVRAVALGGLLATALGCGAPAAGGPSQPASKPAPAGSAASAGAAPVAAPPGAAAAGSPAPWASPLDRVKLSYPGTSIGALHVFIAEEQGLYKQYGLDVEAVRMAPNIATTALATGEAPYSSAIGSVIRGALKGLPMRAILSANDTPYTFLVVKPDIRTSADLRGRVIGTSVPGGSSYIVTKLMLRAIGLEPDRDVSLLNVGEVSSGFESLRNGVVDAAALSPPWPQEAERAGFHTLVSGTTPVVMPMSGIGTTQDKLTRQRDEVIRLTMAHLAAQRSLREDRAGTIELFAKRLELDRETATAAYDSVRDIFGPGDLRRSGLTTVIETEIELGNVAQMPPLEDVADFTVVPEARQRAGG